MSSGIVRRQKKRSPPSQPVDRHLSEIGEFDGTIYINAGIDSTCSKKRSRTLHKLTDGIVVSTVTSTMKTQRSNQHTDNLSSNHDRCDSSNNTHCLHCGKRN